MATGDPSKHYGNPGASLAPEVQQQIIDLCRQGVSRNEIRRRLHVGATAISGIISRAGLSFDRSQIAAAAAARKVDLSARRVRVIERGYKRVEHLQDRLEAKTFHTLQKTRGGGEMPAELDFVPSVDEKNIATTIGSYLGTVLRLEQIDAGDAAADVKSMLTSLGRELGLIP